MNQNLILHSFLSKSASKELLLFEWENVVNNFLEFWGDFKKKKHVEWADFELFYNSWVSIDHMHRLVFTLKYTDNKWQETVNVIQRKYEELVHKIFEGQLIYKKMIQLKGKKLLPWQKEVLDSSGVLHTIGWSPQKVRQMQCRIQQKIKVLERKINDNVIESQESAFLWVDINSRADLHLIPKELLDIAKERAVNMQRNGYIFKAYPDEYDSFMMYCTNRRLRHKMYRIKNSLAADLGAKGCYDNSMVVQALLKQRKREANGFGFETYAHMVLSNSILQNQENVVSFLEDLVLAIYPSCVLHYDEMVNFAKREYQWKKIEPWDYRYLQYQYNVQKQGSPLVQKCNEFNTVNRSFGSVLRKTLKILSGLMDFEVIVENQKRANGFWKCKIMEKNGETLGDILIIDERTNVKDMDLLPFNVDIIMGQQGREALSVIFLQKSNANEWTHEEYLYLLHELGHALQNILTRPIHEQLGILQMPMDVIEVFSQLMEHLGFEDVFVEEVFGKGNVRIWKRQGVTRLQKDALIMNQIVNALADIKLHSVYNPNGKKKPWLVLGEVRKSVYLNDIKGYNRSGNQLRTLSGTYPCSEYQYLLGEVFAGLIWEKICKVNPVDFRDGFKLMRNVFFQCKNPKRFDWAVRQFCDQGFDVHAIVRGRNKMDRWFNV